MASKLKVELRPFVLKDKTQVSKFMRNAGIEETTSSRVGFREWLSYIYRHTPTELEMKNAIDMNFIRPIGSPVAIHEDWICIEDYMREYENKLFVWEGAKIKLTELGKKVLANLL